MNFLTYVVEQNLGSVETKYTFRELTTIGCGGEIECVYFPKDIEALQKAYRYIKEHNLRYFVLGNGSNVLASDYFYSGIVICLKKMPYHYEVKDKTITVSAFYPTINLAYDLASKNLGDLSFLGGIPGLLGGAIYNNSGAYKDNISNHVIEVSYIDTAGNIQRINSSMCAFGYRSSIFHYIEGIIIEAVLRIESVDTKAILEKRKRQRQQTQPLGARSMGSVFKNNPLIPTWKIVDALHLRGFKIGDAAISAKHTNFIINMGNAKSSDILNLIELIETRSKLEFGIQLYSEITIL